MYARRLFFLSFFLLVLLSSCQRSVRIHPHQRVIKIGDNTAWAAKTLNDSSWDKYGITDKNAVYWLRYKIQLDEKYISLMKDPGIEVISLGSFDVYWDGVLIGKNGTVGQNKQTEIPGDFLSYFQLPDSLLGQGEHVLALRVSNFYNQSFASWHNFAVGDYFQLVRNPLIINALMYILAGTFFITGLYYLFLFVNQRSAYPILIFSILAFLFFALIVIEYLKFYYLYPYPFHIIRLNIIAILTLIIAVLTPWFFTIYFSIPYKELFLGIQGLILASFHFVFYKNYDLIAYESIRTMWIMSLIIVGFGIILKRKESQIVFGGLMLSILVTYVIRNDNIAFLQNYDVAVFIGFSILVICMLYLLAIRAKEQKKAYERSLLLSARLKNELLKKSIQPHFIMNTLTSLIDWVEESPKTGVQFIEALAEEFEILNQIADQKLIPIGTEINLCKQHLEIMGYRKEINYQWEDQGINKDKMIPPAILHTIIENGITHSKPNPDGTIQFLLKYKAGKESEKYQVYTFAQNRTTQTISKYGTGLRYVQSRLEENYFEKWNLKTGPIKNGWRTEITIYN